MLISSKVLSTELHFIVLLRLNYNRKQSEDFKQNILEKKKVLIKQTREKNRIRKVNSNSSSKQSC